MSPTIACTDLGYAQQLLPRASHFRETNRAFCSRKAQNFRRLRNFQPQNRIATEPIKSFRIKDGRQVLIVKEESQVSDCVVALVESAARSAIKSKGAFSLSVGSGTTVSPLTRLAASKHIDWTKVHVFFGNERVAGDTAGKCASGAMEVFVEICGVPVGNIHKMPVLNSQGPSTPAEAARLYEKELFSQPLHILSRAAGGVPSVDLLLLGTGPDGHTGSLYPDSAQIKTRGSVACLPVNTAGKQGVAMSIDYMCAAKTAVLSAAREAHAPMVLTALGGNVDASTNTSCPAGMVKSREKTIWLLTEASASLLDENDLVGEVTVGTREYFEGFLSSPINDSSVTASSRGDGTEQAIKMAGSTIGFLGILFLGFMASNGLL